MYTPKIHLFWHSADSEKTAQNTYRKPTVYAAQILNSAKLLVWVFYQYANIKLLRNIKKRLKTILQRFKRMFYKLKLCIQFNCNIELY